MSRLAIETVTDKRLLKFVFSSIGDRVQEKIGKHKLAIQLASSFAMILVMYKVYGCFFQNVKQSAVKDSDRKYHIQSTNQNQKIQNEKEIIEVPPDIVERKNPWYKDDYETTPFDVSAMTKSYKGISVETLNDILFSNSIFVKIYRKVEDKWITRPTRMTCLGGQLYMLNYHAVCLPGEKEMKVYFNNQTGVNRNITIPITEDMMFHIPEKDISFMRIRNLPPRKDISNLFCEKSLEGRYKGYYINRTMEGERRMVCVDNIKLEKMLWVAEMDKNIDSWVGLVNTPMVDGDCGSLLVSWSSYGPIILGIHYLGGGAGAVSIKVCIDDIKLAKKEFNDLMVQNGIPSLSSCSAIHNLKELHKKSTFRYIECGSANVYGSLDSYKGKPKSRVEISCIADFLLDKGYSIKYGPPCMEGYLPWYNGSCDLVKPNTIIRSDILRACVDAFFNDIISKLSCDDLKVLMVYDTFTAVNGARSVTYVDKINRNTSAGFPWCRTKKYFLKCIKPTRGLQNPVELDPEILKRIDYIEECYKNGMRYDPVFTASMKDEAIKLRKILLALTRIFTGAPLDWIVVVRKNLLSFIKLMQSCRFAFEAGPGTIAQSPEWGDIYHYLTKWGPNTIVAGDYKTFDRTMGAIVILCAFDVIFLTLQYAGMTGSHLLSVMCIAFDTAFAWVNYNGDLVEFLGMNPSGHPLTVIINSIVNSLYMRYAYFVLNPNKECSSFQDNVRLFTYGDDNVMGVNPNAAWFNHTAIQEVLADVNIVYTMADKEAKSVPFINISEVSFLKRYWRYDEDVKDYLCPLEEESIEKSLMVIVRSKTVSKEHQIVSVLSNAHREYFNYGKRIFHEKAELFQEVLTVHGLHAYVEDGMFPTWQQMVDSFYEPKYETVAEPL